MRKRLEFFDAGGDAVYHVVRGFRVEEDRLPCRNIDPVRAVAETRGESESRVESGIHHFEAFVKQVPDFASIAATLFFGQFVADHPLKDFLGVAPFGKDPPVDARSGCACIENFAVFNLR